MPLEVVESYISTTALKYRKSFTEVNATTSAHLVTHTHFLLIRPVWHDTDMQSIVQKKSGVSGSVELRSLEGIHMKQGLLVSLSTI